jgi:hypothetical protein
MSGQIAVLTTPEYRQNRATLTNEAAREIGSLDRVEDCGPACCVAAGEGGCGGIPGNGEFVGIL